MKQKSASLNTLSLTLDRDSGVSLQEQIRRKIVDGIEAGLLPAGMKLPSSRALSTALSVSRNTTAGAYERLLSDGHLISRDRSGVFIREDVESLHPARVSGSASRNGAQAWRDRLTFSGDGQMQGALAPDWEKYPFPFIDGPFDRSLFPVGEWREASRSAMAVSEIDAWTHDAGDADDPMLIDELRRKVLPRRGIAARHEEILITTGAQQGLHLITELLVQSKSVIGIENPCSPELRMLLERKGARLETFSIDEDGLEFDPERLRRCALLFTSPGRQRPMGVSLSQARREKLLDLADETGLVIVEDDYQWEAGFAFSDRRALRGEPGGENTLYVATLAQPLSSAVRLGVLVAPATVIRAARTLRRITARHPALSIQRTFAHMLAMGHYATALRRVESAFANRMIALRDALNHYLPKKVSILTPQLGVTAWITGPPEMDVARFTKAAEAEGALIEPVAGYFDGDAPTNVFRLGVSSIEEEKIREGVAVIAKALRDSLAPIPPEKAPDKSKSLNGAALKEACSGATLLCKTVYGEPCTITLHRDGRMTGTAGFASEDRDTGKWWIEDGYWCRQWNEWAYGETAKFLVVVSGDRMQWLNAEGRLIDWAIIERSKAGNSKKLQNT
ncbi:MAG: PLP-dependent aminotransferase family protein [Pseudomonadota bacterium]